MPTNLSFSRDWYLQTETTRRSDARNYSVFRFCRPNDVIRAKINLRTHEEKRDSSYFLVYVNAVRPVCASLKIVLKPISTCVNWVFMLGHVHDKHLFLLPKSVIILWDFRRRATYTLFSVDWCFSIFSRARTLISLLVSQVLCMFYTQSESEWDIYLYRSGERDEDSSGGAEAVLFYDNVDTDRRWIDSLIISATRKNEVKLNLAA